MGEDTKKATGEGGYLIESQRMWNCDNKSRLQQSANCKLSTFNKTSDFLEDIKVVELYIFLLTALPKVLPDLLTKGSPYSILHAVASFHDCLQGWEMRLRSCSASWSSQAVCLAYSPHCLRTQAHNVAHSSYNYSCWNQGGCVSKTKVLNYAYMHNCMRNIKPSISGQITALD